jgi:hypothetical protein
MAVPINVKLKDPSAFRIVGTPAKRLDVAGKVDGTAVFGIDVKVPGMKIATVAASPVFGGTLTSIPLGVSGCASTIPVMCTVGGFFVKHPPHHTHKHNAPAPTHEAQLLLQLQDQLLI